MINNTVPFKINSVLCCIAGIACFNGALLVTIAVLVLHVYLCIPQALTEHCKRALRVEQGREPQRQARRLELRQLQLRPHRRVRAQHVVDRHSVRHKLAEARLVADVCSAPWGEPGLAKLERVRPYLQKPYTYLQSAKINPFRITFVL